MVGPTHMKIVCFSLNEGTQGNFVHDNVVKALKLPIIRQGTFNLHTFGCPAPSTLKRNIMKLSLKNVRDKQQSIEMEAVRTLKVFTAVMKVPGDLAVYPIDE